ncbi:hypothetical protein V6N13_088048 [Hibiscus sabdariffa]
MNVNNFLCNSTMKLLSRVLSLRNASFWGFKHSFNLLCCDQKLSCEAKAFPFNFNQSSRFHAYPLRFLCLQRIISNTQNSNCLQSSGFTHSRPYGVYIQARVASTTSVETGVKDKNFERICIQKDINVKPCVVERVAKDENIVGGNVPLAEGGMETVGTVAANDPGDKQPLNYDQVFIRDFVPSALAFLLGGEGEIVKNFLLHTLQLQSWEKTVDCYSPGQGLMPASFKVRTVPLDDNKFEEVLDPDFGESAIGRVAPVDSGLWWIILLRAYGKITGDYAFQERVDVQTGIKLILNLCLADGFDMFPSLLVTDGSCMIDRRMGIHGHPLEIQALFYSALRCAREILNAECYKNLVSAINNRLSALSFHIREYYWVDMKKVNEIYRYKTEEYSMDATNKFNIYPDQIPSWLMDWIPEEGGYLIGNLQPAHMDFRFFTLGNLWSIVSSLATPKQNEAILNLIEAKWDDIVGNMPCKICYPAVENEEWRIITGCDPKNTPWSYHNGGSWPTLLWQFTLACIKMGRLQLAQKAVSLAEKRLSIDRWPEYYDTRSGKFIGKQSRLYQTWTIAGFLTSRMMVENPQLASLLFWEEDYELLEICVCALNKSGRKKCSRGAAKSQILLETLVRDLNSRPPENLAPPTDPVITGSNVAFGEGQKDLNVPSFDGSQFPALERSGFPLSPEDVQAAKRGCSTAAAADSDALKSMEVDDHLDSVSEGGATDGAVTVTVEDETIPPTSYARVVVGSGDKLLSDPVPSLDDGVVEAEDVTVNMSSLFPSVAFSEMVHARIDHTSSNQSRPLPTEDTVYGPWMVAGSRQRQMRKDSRSNGVQPTGNRFGGSRFNVLNEFDSADVTPGNIAKPSEPNGVVIPANNNSLVGNYALGAARRVVDLPSVNAASDVSRKTSSGVVLNEVIVNENAPVPIVYFWEESNSTGCHP